MVNLLDGCLGLLGDVAHDAVYHLRLVVSLLALYDILRRHSALRQIDVTLVLVYTEYDDDFVAANSDELLDRSNTSSRKFGKQDHAVDVVWILLVLLVIPSICPEPTIFEQLDVCAHLCDLLHVDHDEALHLRVLLLVESAICKRHDECVLFVFS